MVEEKKLLAIIPARANSKRLPGKNLAELGGKPLIAWTIEAALNSKHVDRVVVSTDSEEIAQISVEWGAEVPFMRPANLATDDATSSSVIQHVINKINARSIHYDDFVLLQPTSPFRTANHIDQAVSLFKTKKPDSVISVTPVEHSVDWIGVLDEGLIMKEFVCLDQNTNKDRENVNHFRINGAIYISRVYIEKDKRRPSIWGKYCVGYRMPWRASIDIDTRSDLLVAKALLGKS